MPIGCSAVSGLAAKPPHQPKATKVFVCGDFFWGFGAKLALTPFSNVERRHLRTLIRTLERLATPARNLRLVARSQMKVLGFFVAS